MMMICSAQRDLPAVALPPGSSFVVGVALAVDGGYTAASSQCLREIELNTTSGAADNLLAGFSEGSLRRRSATGPASSAPSC